MEQTVKTICPYCGVGCGLTVKVRDVRQRRPAHLLRRHRIGGMLSHRRREHGGLPSGALATCQTPRHSQTRPHDRHGSAPHRILENTGEVFAWLERGAAFYVCGGASRMAKDVDAALHQVIQIAAGKSVQQAADYVKALSASKRYQRDVY